MRPIKFRVWDKEKKIFLEESIYNSVAITFDGYIFSGRNDYIDKSDRYEIQQSTGMTDKSGKDLYEGDIVNFAYNVNTQMICRVEWSERFFGFFLNHYNNESLVFQSRLCETNKSKITIIGHIFEN